MNPLFSMLGGGSPMGGMMPGMGGGNNPMQMIQKFMEFKNNFKGNPQEEVQKMLQSGQITQQQLDQAQQMAQLRQPQPVPAYTVPAPYPYASNCGCGCNTGCGC